MRLTLTLRRKRRFRQSRSYRNYRSDLVAEAFFVFGQGLAARFGGEGEHNQAKQENGAHYQAGITHPFLITICLAENAVGKQAENGGPGGGHKAADVVAERGAGAAEIGGKQLGKIDGVAAEE